MTLAKARAYTYIQAAYISEQLRHLVAYRADRICEYCLISDASSTTAHDQVDNFCV